MRVIHWSSVVSLRNYTKCTRQVSGTSFVSPLPFALTHKAGIVLGDILLADVIDNDSFRLWEDGDSNKMRDGEIMHTRYENKEDVTPEILATVKENYTWAANKSKVFRRLEKLLNFVFIICLAIP